MVQEQQGFIKAPGFETQQNKAGEGEAEKTPPYSKKNFFLNFLVTNM